MIKCISGPRTEAWPLTAEQLLAQLREEWRTADPHTREDIEFIAAAVKTVQAGGLA